MTPRKIVQLGAAAIDFPVDTSRERSLRYVFPDIGIVFKPNPTPYQGCIANPPSPDLSFHNCTPKQGGSEFHCNKGGPKDTGACYSYTVTVLPTLPNAPIPPPLDPWIISD